MFKIEKVSAHCDIPCGVYDPGAAQYAVLSVIRFIDLINEMPEAVSSKDDLAKFTRLVQQKEEHAVIAKNEITIIWGDYFKAPQIEQYPGVHELVHGIMTIQLQLHTQPQMLLLIIVQIVTILEQLQLETIYHTYQTQLGR